MNEIRCPHCGGEVRLICSVAVCKSCGKILPSRTVIEKPSENDNESLI